MLRFVFDTMFREFAQTVGTRTSHKLDVQRGLHQQRMLDAAETDLFAERRVPFTSRDSGFLVCPGQR